MRFECWRRCHSTNDTDDDDTDEEEEACENFFSNALGTYAKGNDQVLLGLPDTIFKRGFGDNDSTLFLD